MPEPRDLPDWREHSGNRKTGRLELPASPPDAVLVEFLEATARDMGKAPGQLRILDLGCGRGALVAWLLSKGWDAWGADVSAQYVEAGDELTRQLGGGQQRLRAIEGAGLPFDQPFDVILSEQVLEHVMDLPAFTSQVKGASRPGTRGLHILPAKWAPVETHMKLPFVHWLPKGRARELAIGLMLRVGLGVDHFTEYSNADRTRIFSRFSDGETDYKTVPDLRRAFTAEGMSCDFTSGPMMKLSRKAPGIPRPIAALLAGAYSRFQATYLITTQIR